MLVACYSLFAGLTESGNQLKIPKWHGLQPSKRQGLQPSKRHGLQIRASDLANTFLRARRSQPTEGSSPKVNSRQRGKKRGQPGNGANRAKAGLQIRASEVYPLHLYRPIFKVLDLAPSPFRGKAGIGVYSSGRRLNQGTPFSLSPQPSTSLNTL